MKVLLHLALILTLSSVWMEAEGKGIALIKKYVTEDNFQMHMASSHFGHFLLTNLLASLLVNSSMKKANPGRIVVVPSLAHCLGKIELDNLNSERSYDDFYAPVPQTGGHFQIF
ncbi:hypothetical protein TCAL_15369 [Tigriopus californicus]|uniref:Serpin domain-containing protein n=1 Tax=Tigriopus californicus TaxID=6832 RepID=A0A553PML1_TIGCA|nr:hypothetical protein TCAL_15369 [Tigriopus californicus]